MQSTSGLCEQIPVYAAYIHTSPQRNCKMLGLMDFQIPMRSNLNILCLFFSTQTPGQSSAKRRKRESYEAGSSTSPSQNREVAENSTFVPFKYSEADYSTFSSKGLICFGIIGRIGLTYKETSSCLGGFFFSRLASIAVKKDGTLKTCSRLFLNRRRESF